MDDGNVRRNSICDWQTGNLTPSGLRGSGFDRTRVVAPKAERAVASSRFNPRPLLGRSAKADRADGSAVARTVALGPVLSALRALHPRARRRAAQAGAGSAALHPMSTHAFSCSDRFLSRRATRAAGGSFAHEWWQRRDRCRWSGKARRRAHPPRRCGHGGSRTRALINAARSTAASPR